MIRNKTFGKQISIKQVVIKPISGLDIVKEVIKNARILSG